MSFEPDLVSYPSAQQSGLSQQSQSLENNASMSSEINPKPTEPNPKQDSVLSSRSSYRIAIFDDHLRSMDLVEGTLLIGRSQKNHLTLNDGVLSRKHCSLTMNASGLTLVDLNSSNGTFVNGERIGTKELKKDDIVELGKTVLVIYDGNCWQRGEGLLNLRNPLKAQELIQKLRDGVVKQLDMAKPGMIANGVRQHKGLTDREKEFLRWLEQGEVVHLPSLVADYLSSKLISLLLRNSDSVRAATTATLEEMMRPEFFQRFGLTGDLKKAIGQLFEEELQDLRGGEPPALHRDLLGEDPISLAKEAAVEQSIDQKDPAALTNPDETAE